MFNRRIKVLWHGEFGMHTGFGTASENIVDRLINIRTEIGTPKFELCVMALGQNVNPFDMNKKKPYEVIPMFGDRNRFPFGQDTAQEIVRRFRPDVVVSFGDTWMIDFWNDPAFMPQDLRKTFKLIGYAAIDGYPIYPEWINKYRGFDKVIAFTKFGKDAIDERAKEMGVKLNTAYIYHGVDTLTYKPLPRTQVDDFKRSRGIQDKKIIGFFSRNQPRKHHPEFLEFASAILDATDNDPNISFYMHTMERDAGWDIPTLIKDMDNLNPRGRFLKEGHFSPGQEIPAKKSILNNRFMFPGIQNPAQGYPRDLLNMMYNICDAHILLTSGEGFGLTLIESLSAGTPTFTNNYAAGAELVKDSGGGETINAREYTYRGSDHNFYRPHTDYQDAVAKVLPVITDPTLREKYSKKARAYAMGLTWDILNSDWERELDDVFTLDAKKSPTLEAV